MDDPANEREVTITRFFDAPREVVFAAFTDAERIATWWGPEGFSVPECASDARPGGAFRIVMRGPDGADYPAEGTFVELDPPGRIVMRPVAVAPDGGTLIDGTTTVTLADRDGKTELTLLARAIARTPEAARMLSGMEAGWSQSLQRLDDVLTGADDRQIVLLRLIETPREVVFRAWTDPDRLPMWFGPEGFSMSVDEIDVRPGGMWRSTMHGPDGVDYPNLIAYEEIDEPSRLVYTHSGAGEAADDPSFRTTVTFDAFDGQTVLTMRAVFADAASRALVEDKYHAIEGGNQTLDRLVAYVMEREE